MSFDAPRTMKGCLLLTLAIAACGERAAPVDSGHAPAAPATALARRADRSLPRDLTLRDGLAITLGERAPAGWSSRVANIATCQGSCPDSGYWFGAPLLHDVTGVAAHPGVNGRIMLIQGSVDARVPFDSVLARFVARLGVPSSEARAPGGDAHVTWQDSVTTVELSGTPGSASRSWFLMSDDTPATPAAGAPTTPPARKR